MARKLDLMGIGIPAQQALYQATEPSTLAASGSSLASCVAAAPIGGQQYLVAVTSGTSGVALPSIGGFNGALLGDDFIVNNQTSATIVVFAPGGVTISSGTSNQTGTTGTSVAAHTATTFYPITTTSWLGVKGS